MFFSPPPPQSNKWNVLFGPRGRTWKDGPRTVTRGFNRPLNQFVQHQDKTRMYNFFQTTASSTSTSCPVLRVTPPPFMIGFRSERITLLFFFSHLPLPCCRKWADRVQMRFRRGQSQYNLRNLLFSAKPRETDSGRAPQTQLIPVQNNFHILRTENEKNEWAPSSLAVNDPSSWQHRPSRSERRPTCAAFSGCLGWRSPSEVFAFISPPPSPLPASALTTAFYYTEGIWLMQCAVGPPPRANF